MARAKRFYLCNLIPLWEIDNAHLEVDWTQDAAKNGEIVEMRVVVKDLDLNMTTPDFTIEFEVNENDVLLFGGLDDRVVTITNKAAEKKTEHRDIAIIGANDAVPPDQRLTKIFLSPVPNAAPQKLIRAFWSAAWQKDVAGSPEYYFDVKLEFTGKKFKERSDRELTVSEEGVAGGSGTTVDPTVAGPLVLPAVGWSLKDVFATESVDQLALLDPPNAGKPVSFVITPDVNATLLWILFIPKSNDAPASGTLIKKPWTVPRFLPLENIENLELKGKIGDKEVKATTVEKAEAERFPGQTGGFFGRLKLNQGRETVKVEDSSITVPEQQTMANGFLADPALAKLKEALDKELAAWATAKSKNIDPADSYYAYTIQEYAFNLTHGSDSLILPKPSSSSALKKWTDKFQKNYLLGLMIMSSGSKVSDREKRAELVAQSLAEVGFFTEALNIVGMFKSREEQEFTYDVILKSGRATVEQWTLLLNYFTAGTAAIPNNIIETFGFNRGSIEVEGVDTRRLLPVDTRAFIEKLGANNTERNTKLDTIATALIDFYANDTDIIWIFSSFLFLQPSFRQPFTDKIWRQNNSYLLFKILNSYEFTEPGYLDPPPTWDGVVMTMGVDMPWVYQNKQRFAVYFLVFLCERAGTPIPRPANLSFNSLRSWLEAQTETIAAAGPKVYPDIKDHWFELYNLVTDVFFFHVDRGDVTPDLHGHIGALPASEPANLRLRADCDVFATYGTRFLRAMGFTSIGYMGIWAMTAAGGFGIGHAGALLKKDTAYYIVNNKEAFRIAGTTQADAEIRLRDSILDVLNNPTDKQIHYVASDATGGMPDVIFDRTNATRRTDLE